VIRQDPTTDPGALTDEVRRVMAREEFQYEKSWFDRLSDWIGRQLERLFGGDGGGSVPAGGSSFAGGIGSVIAWILILAAVAAVVAVIAYVVLHRVRRVRDDDGPESEVEIEHRRSAREWEGDAARLEAEGDWKGALRARYRHLVRTLVDRRQLPDIAGRTTGELREDLAGTTPDAGDAFDTASLLFELAWYAHVPSGPEQSEQFRAAAQAVLAARATSRSDAAPAAGDTVEVRA
jgi:Domain of unknown function (DUF4129)